MLACWPISSSEWVYDFKTQNIKKPFVYVDIHIYLFQTLVSSPQRFVGKGVSILLSCLFWRIKVKIALSFPISRLLDWSLAVTLLWSRAPGCSDWLLSSSLISSRSSWRPSVSLISIPDRSWRTDCWQFYLHCSGGNVALTHSLPACPAHPEGVRNV